MTWISVKDELPFPSKNMRQVLVQVALYDSTRKKYFVTYAYFDGMFFEDSFGDNIQSAYQEITHWAPLLEPPLENK